MTNVETELFSPEAFEILDKNKELIDINGEAFLEGITDLVKERKLLPITSMFTRHEMELMFRIGVKMGIQITLERNR